MTAWCGNGSIAAHSIELVSSGDTQETRLTPRQLRIEYEGALYHITDRGVERREIFLDRRDYEKFLDYLARAIECYRLLIHAFCLIPNHYHLECQTLCANLSRAMHWLNTSYAMYFNRRYQRSGHLFQGRYNALLVQKEKHLQALTRYIHLNPVRAKLVSSPEKYEWSSLQDYLRMDKLHKWLETEWTLSQFGKTVKRARQAYQEFVEDGLRRKLKDPTKEAAGGVILGDREFVDSITGRFLGDRTLDHEKPHQGSPRSVVTIDQVIEATCEAFGVNTEDVRRKGSHGNTPRDVALYLSRRHCGLKNSEVGEEFEGMVRSNVSNICRKIESALRRNQSLREMLTRVEECILGN